MPDSKRTAINLSSQIISFLINVGITFFLTPFIVDKIGKEVYGFVGLANNITGYITIITTAVNSLANRYITIAYVKNDIPLAKRYYSSVTAANILIVAIFAVPITVLVSKLELFINIPDIFMIDIKLLWLFIFLAFFLNLIFGRMSVATFAKNRLDLAASANILSNVLKLVLLVLMFMLLPAKVYYLGIATFVCTVLAVILNCYFKHTQTPELIFCANDVQIQKIWEIFKNGIWNSINQLSELLFTGLDLLLANLFIGVTQMSLLSIAKSIPLQAITFISTVAGVFYPFMTISYAKKSSDEFVTETSHALRLCGLVCSVLIMGIIVFGKNFYRFWLPTLSADEVNLVQTLSVLTLLPQVFSVYIFPLYHVNTLSCKLKWPALVNLILGVVNVLMVFTLLKCTSLGIYAIAGVSSILQVLKILIFVPVYASKNLKKSIWTFYPTILRGVLFNVVLFGAFSVIKVLIIPDTLIKFAAAILVSAVVGYIIGSFIVLDRSDRRNLINTVLKKVKIR